MSNADDAKITEDYVKLLKDTFWIESCCCYGAGCIKPTVFMEGQEKICCLQQFCTSGEDFCDSTGCIRNSGKVCCLMSHAQFPPAIFRVGLCNVFCCGEAPGQAREMEARDSDTLDESFMAGGFWLTYCCCSGCGFTSNVCDPMFQEQLKIGCVFSKVFTTDFCGPRGILNSHGQLCCFASYCALPPHITPGFGCCNVMCCGGNVDGFAKMPGQMEMADEIGAAR